MLRIKDLTVDYPDKTRAVDRLSLSIGPAESVALIGANGAGKTSLILAIMGILDVQGEIEFDQLRLSAKTLPDIRARIGVVFQNPDDQLFMPTINADIAFGLSGRGLTPDQISQRTEECLVRLGLTHLRGKTPLRLSGGEKRMAALATVLVMEPSLMIFDEPTAFLDHKARRKLIWTLNSLGEAKLIATHDLPFALETCRRAVLLKNGRVFADGPSDLLLTDTILMDECGMEAIPAGSGGLCL